MFSLFRSKSRCEGEIPLTNFTGWLRCHRPDPADLSSQFLLNEVFLSFLGGERPPPLDPIQAAIKEVAEEKGFEILDTSSNKPGRRFAGDWAGLRLLDRGRYYSVCKNEAGDDGGTLTNELNAYLKPNQTGLAIALNSSGDPAVHAYITDVVGFPSVPMESLRRLGLRTADDSDASLQLKTTVEAVSIERVFDLRYPEARDWLFGKFGNGDSDWIAYHGPRVSESDGYWALLPTIMDLKAGGNGFTDQVAGYLRNHAVQAMIFPSARSDTLVTFVNGRLGDFAGWNLVDWRGSEPPPKRKSEWITPWIPPNGNWQVRVAANETYKGSYSVHGNVAHHMWLFHVALLSGIAERMERDGQKVDTGYVRGYRWHTSRITGTHYMAQCLKCGDETGFPERPWPAMPPSCTRCGYSDSSVVQ